MTTSDPSPPSHGADARPAKPSARRYCIWQAAMWITIVHTVLVGGFTAFAVGLESKPYSKHLDWDWLFHGTAPIHRRLAFFMIDWPCPLILLAFALAPIAIIATYRASLGKRSWVWFLAYWLAGTTVCLLLVASIALLGFYRVWGLGEYFSFHDHLTGSGAMCGIFLTPLLITFLAALLTIERKKRPPAAQAGT